MNIGIISDIHANLANLRRALTLLRDLGADVIVCAGDLVDGETEGSAAVDLIRANQIPCVQGNHDRGLSRANSNQWLAYRDEIYGELPTDYHLDDLSDDSRAFLRDLPPSLRFEWENRRVLLSHASTWDQVTYCYANGRHDPFYRIAAEAEADIVILGHTHMPMAVEVGGIWVFNPGSVDGNRYEPYASTCALLELPRLRYRVFDIAAKKPATYLFTRLSLHDQQAHGHIDQH